MGMQPICPKCGTVKVQKDGKQGTCLEVDCGASENWEKFKVPFGPSNSGNKHWRDPVAMSMDGYDE